MLHKGPKLRTLADVNQSKVNEEQFIDFLNSYAVECYIPGSATDKAKFFISHCT